MLVFFFEFFGVVYGEFEVVMVVMYVGGFVLVWIWNCFVREG